MNTFISYFGDCKFCMIRISLRRMNTFFMVWIWKYVTVLHFSFLMLGFGTLLNCPLCMFINDNSRTIANI